jgi:hypothetical protein
MHTRGHTFAQKTIHVHAKIRRMSFIAEQKLAYKSVLDQQAEGDRQRQQTVCVCVCALGHCV